MTYARLHHRGSKFDPRSDLRSTQKTVAPFEFRAGVEIEIKFILNHRNWRFEISSRGQQPSLTNIKLDPGSELGSFYLGSGKMLVQPGNTVVMVGQASGPIDNSSGSCQKKYGLHNQCTEIEEDRGNGAFEHLMVISEIPYERAIRHFTSLGRYSLSAGVDRLLVRNLGHPVGYQLVCGGEEKLTPSPLRTHQTYFKLQSNIIVQDSQGSAWELYHDDSVLTSSAYTRQKAKSKYRNRIRLERASQKQSRDTHKTSYDRLKRYRERKICIKASERVNVDVFTQNKRPCPQHSHTPSFYPKVRCGEKKSKLRRDLHVVRDASQSSLNTVDWELQCQTVSPDFIIGFSGLPPNKGRKFNDVFTSKRACRAQFVAYMRIHIARNAVRKSASSNFLASREYSIACNSHQSRDKSPLPGSRTSEWAFIRRSATTHLSDFLVYLAQPTSSREKPHTMSRDFELKDLDRRVRSGVSTEPRQNSRAIETGDTREKPADWQCRPARFPYAKIRERPSRESNPVHLNGRREL
ncbi:hypothetical protein PR048_026463 [Dryococelus australis]|uniref:Uncharacterized protein n=1 Tax=Dryococelus australis TaxID=614101 RepID=A0ABQ9GLF4_9NEOP|nr:hypothetical protein PR048_026463 [Dryococelus australis]